jgi:hypothetical protein
LSRNRFPVTAIQFRRYIYRKTQIAHAGSVRVRSGTERTRLPPRLITAFALHSIIVSNASTVHAFGARRLEKKMPASWSNGASVGFFIMPTAHGKVTAEMPLR